MGVILQLLGVVRLGVSQSLPRQPHCGARHRPRTPRLQHGMRNRPPAAQRPSLPPIEHVSITAATPGLPARAYRAGLKRCAQTGEWRAALQLLERLAAIYDAAPPHSPSYANAMLACRRGGMWPVALQLLTELQEGGGQLDAFVASNAIAACEPAGRWEQALAILRALEVTEVPNTVCVNAAISACASGGRWREAMALLRAMEAPNARSYSATISACNRGGAWADALELFEALEPERQDGVCYGAAIAAAAGRGSWRRAIDLLGRMREARLEVELPALNAALHACAKAKRWEEALQLLREMRAGGGAQPNRISYNAVSLPDPNPNPNPNPNPPTDH